MRAVFLFANRILSVASLDLYLRHHCQRLHGQSVNATLQGEWEAWWADGLKGRVIFKLCKLRVRTKNGFVFVYFSIIKNLDFFFFHILLEH